MSCQPDYDPNAPRLIDDEARDAVDALTGEERSAALQKAQQAQWRNKAISDLYEPGSVFKLITASAALDSGRVRPRTISPARVKSAWQAHGSAVQTAISTAPRPSPGGWLSAATPALSRSAHGLEKNASAITLRPSACGRPRHRPAGRDQAQRILHSGPDGPGGAGELLVRAEQQGQLPADAHGGVRW